MKLIISIIILLVTDSYFVQAKDCFGQQQLPLVFGNTVDDYKITAVAQIAQDLVFGGSAGSYPMLGYYHQTNNFHVVKWLYSYDTSGEANTVKSIAYRSSVLFVNFYGSTNEIYAKIDPFNGTSILQVKHPRGSNLPKSTAIDVNGNIYVIGNISPGSSYGHLTQLDKDFNTKWRVQFEEDPSYVNTLDLNEQGNEIYIGGNFKTFLAGSPMIYKISYDGQTQKGYRYYDSFGAVLFMIDSTFQYIDVEQSGIYVGAYLRKQSDSSKSYFGIVIQNIADDSKFYTYYHETYNVDYDCLGLKSALNSLTILYSQTSSGDTVQRILVIDSTYFDFTASQSSGGTFQLKQLQFQFNTASPPFMNSYHFIDESTAFPIVTGYIIQNSKKKGILTILEQNTQTCYDLVQFPIAVNSSMALGKGFDRGSPTFQNYKTSSLTSPTTLSIQDDLRIYQTELPIWVTPGAHSFSNTTWMDIDNFELDLGIYTLDGCTDQSIGTFRVVMVNKNLPAQVYYNQSYDSVKSVQFTANQEQFKLLGFGVSYTMQIIVSFYWEEGFIFSKDQTTIFDIMIEDCGVHFAQVSPPFAPNIDYVMNASPSKTAIVAPTYTPVGCGYINYSLTLLDESTGAILTDKNISEFLSLNQSTGSIQIQSANYSHVGGYYVQLDTYLNSISTVIVKQLAPIYFKISITSDLVNIIYQSPSFVNSIQDQQVTLGTSLTFILPKINNPDKIDYSLTLLSQTTESFTKIILSSDDSTSVISQPEELSQVGIHLVIIRLKEKNQQSNKFTDYEFKIEVLMTQFQLDLNQSEEQQKNETAYMIQAIHNRTEYLYARIRQVTNRVLKNKG
eukprot:403335598